MLVRGTAPSIAAVISPRSSAAAGRATFSLCSRRPRRVGELGRRRLSIAVSGPATMTLPPPSTEIRTGSTTPSLFHRERYRCLPRDGSDPDRHSPASCCGDIPMMSPGLSRGHGAPGGCAVTATPRPALASAVSSVSASLTLSAIEPSIAAIPTMARPRRTCSTSPRRGLERSDLGREVADAHALVRRHGKTEPSTTAARPGPCRAPPILGHDRRQGHVRTLSQIEVSQRIDLVNGQHLEVATVSVMVTARLGIRCRAGSRLYCPDFGGVYQRSPQLGRATSDPRALGDGDGARGKAGKS